MALNNRKNVAIAAGVLLLAGVGAAAWIHNSESRPAPPPVALSAGALSSIAQPDGPAQSSLVQSSPADGYYPSVPPPVYVRQYQPPPPDVETEDAEPQYASGTGPRGRVIYRTSGERRHHGRSKKHSVEIVAGTAAAGAAIGAIAGGGPGAAIGAIAGGGAGFAYDRLTHNH